VMRSDCLTISESLLTLPENWILEPVCGKRPYRKGWAKTNVDRLFCLAELESGRATGIGLKLGDGLLAVDVDGDSAADLLKKFAGENSLQYFGETIAWSSGRKGRQQYLFSVPESDWARLRNRKIGTGVIGDDGKEEALEFRWLGTQSVLPPSLHPLTEKPYFWVVSPYTNQTLQAPEWLLSLCENLQSEYAGEDEPDLVRFPARLYKFFRRSLAIWLLARCSDDSCKSHGGKNKGSGVGSFSLELAAHCLGRSQGHVRKLLCEATKSGLLRKYKQQGDRITCYYTSFEKIIAIAGIEDIGPVAAVNIDDLSELNILATEIEAQNLQRLSLFQKQREETKAQEAKSGSQNQTRIIRPNDLLHPCEIPARVLAKGDRFLYCESDFAFYGGSQEGIGDRRGISVSTVSRHLSNKYRLKSAPVRGYRAGVSLIVKKQLAERLPLLRGMPAKLCHEDGLFFAHSDWFKPHCNIYLLSHRLISCKRRRLQIDNQSLLKTSSSRADLKDKNLLCVLSEELKKSLINSPELPAQKLEAKLEGMQKPGQ
jgi:Bifunctional DNA primase/polymerase, N-terminal